MLNPLARSRPERARPVALQAGVSLPGLLIGMTLGGLVLTGLATVYLLTARGTLESMRSARLNQELRGVIELMQRDIRRAGYWARPVGARSADNPFQSEIAGIMNDLRTGAATGEAGDSCLTYSYDLNSNGLIGLCEGCAPSMAPFDAAPYDQSNVEMFGFRLRSGAIQMRTRRASQGETSFDCRSGWWEAITSDEVRISSLHFTIDTRTLNLDPTKTLTAACEPLDPCRRIRTVEIRLSGRLAADPAVRQSISALVAVRNDSYGDT
jgi:type II secretory pathway component PulJ